MMKLVLAACVLALPKLQGKTEALDSDKIWKEKAPAIVKRALSEVQKRKSAVVSETNQYAAILQMVNTCFDGTLKGDLAAVKGTAEIYAKGPLVLMNTGKGFEPPERVLTPEGIQAQAFRNPALYLKDLEQSLATATLGGEEAVDGKSCRILDLVASPAVLNQHLKEHADRMSRALKIAQGTNADQFFDSTKHLTPNGTVATYRVCVGKDDLLVYRIEFVIKPKVKTSGLPPELQDLKFDARTEIKFSKWDQDAAFEIPGPVKAKFGLK